MPGKSILRPARSSHTTTPTSPTIEPAVVTSKINVKRLNAGIPSAPSIVPASDEEAETTIREAATTLRERGNQYKQHLLETQKEVSDLRLEIAEALRQLQEARIRIGKLEAKKRKAEDRWRVYKSQFEEVLQRSTEMGNDLREARNQSAYLEKLLAFEERSEILTLVSDTQLQRGHIIEAGLYKTFSSAFTAVPLIEDELESHDYKFNLRLVKPLFIELVSNSDFCVLILVRQIMCGLDCVRLAIWQYVERG